MTREEKLQELTIIFNRLRAKLFCIIEASAIPHEKVVAICRLIKDTTSEGWERIKLLLGD